MEAKGRRLPRTHRDTAASLSSEKDRTVSQEVKIALLQQEVSALREEMQTGFADMREDMKGLLQAWEATGVFGKLVKWLAGIVTAAGILWAVAKGMVGRP